MGGLAVKEKKKRSGGLFMKISIITTALYVLAVVAAVIYFQARQNPVDPMTVAALLSVGVGEFGCCGLIKTASEKRAAAEADVDSAQAEIEVAMAEAEAARAEADEWKAKAQKKKVPAKPAAKASNPKPPTVKAPAKNKAPTKADASPTAAAKMPKKADKSSALEKAPGTAPKKRGTKT
jgi:hypothetical protein